MPIMANRALTIYIAYDITATQDQELFALLTTHMSLLRSQYPTCAWHDSAVSAGSVVTSFVEAQIHAADIIVLLLSADFFASEQSSSLEIKWALTLGKTRAARLIPVRLRPVAWHLSPLSQYPPLPTNGTSLAEAPNHDAACVEIVQGIHLVIEELMQQIMTRTYTIPSRFPRHHSPLPYNARFTDRDRTLADIASFFTSTHSQQTPMLALHGPGGIGKTQIALEYSYRSSHVYQTILWLNASSQRVLSTTIARLANQLSLLDEDDNDEEQLFSAFQQWLQDQSDWLLILDQLEDITLLDLIIPPHSKGRVLLTTRLPAIKKHASMLLTVESMDDNTGAEYLLHCAEILPVEATLAQMPPETAQHARSIAQILHGFPLALDLAGAFLKQTGWDLSHYLQQLSEKANEYQPIASVLALTFEQLDRLHPANLDLLRLLAFLQPDAIPEGLLTHGAIELREPLRSIASNPQILQLHLTHLLNFSLIHYSADRTLLRIHRTVQEILIADLTTTQCQRWARLAVHLVNRVFPELQFETWAECDRYLPQARQCGELIRDYRVSSKKSAQLLERLGAYCYRRAAYNDAETYLNLALSLHKKRRQKDDPAQAQTLNSLALLYYQQARYEEAERFQQQALVLRERAYGPHHPKTAESLHNLALLYGDTGKDQQAEQLYTRVLDLEEQTKGIHHPDVARTLNNLGLLCFQREDYTQAETHYQRALAIYKHSLPSDHPDLAYTLNNLGGLARKRGDLQQARDFYQQALHIRKQHFGENHPDVAHSYNKLAGIVQLQGDFKQAECFYQRALTIGEQIWQPDHPDLALFLNNLALLALKQQHYQQAEKLFLQALHIYEQKLGPEHPHVANVLTNLGHLLHKTHNDERAETFLQRARSIRKQQDQ